MGNNVAETTQPCEEYDSPRTRSASFESTLSEIAVSLAPIRGEEGKPSISVSCNLKRDYKDKRIYVNPRTGLPIRPPTSFGLFMHAMRRSMKTGKVTFSDFHKKAISQWMKMSEAEKEPYVERSKILGDRYKKIEVFYLRKRVRQLQNEIKDRRDEAIYAGSSRVRDDEEDSFYDRGSCRRRN